MDGNKYCGYYRTKYGSHSGTIAKRYEGRWEFLIHDTPDCIVRHSHYCCFFSRGNGAFEIHFATPPANVDDGISKIEKVLIEAYEHRNCK